MQNLRILLIYPPSTSSLSESTLTENSDVLLSLCTVVDWYGNATSVSIFNLSLNQNILFNLSLVSI